MAVRTDAGGAGSRRRCQRTICTRQIIATRRPVRRHMLLQAGPRRSALLRLNAELRLTPQTTAAAAAASCVCKDRRERRRGKRAPMEGKQIAFVVLYI